MIILITRPKHDKETNYLFYWSKSVIDFINQKKTVKLIDLPGEKATNNTLRQYLRKFTPSFMLLNGHGSAGTIMGHNNQIVIDEKDNLSVFKHTVLYSRSCMSGARLGPKLIKSGVKSFLGYKRDFAFAYSPKYITRPLSDNLASLFLEPSNLIVTSLIKGNTTEEAYNKSLIAMRKNFRKLLTSSSTNNERYYSWVLWSNIKCQVLLGDKSATI